MFSIMTRTKEKIKSIDLGKLKNLFLVVRKNEFFLRELIKKSSLNVFKSHFKVKIQKKSEYCN